MKTMAELERTFYRNLDVKDISRESYIRAFDRFKRWVVYRGLDAMKLTRADILAYKAWMEKKSGYSEATMSLYLLVVRLFYGWVEANGYGENIAAGIRYKRKHRGYYKEHLEEWEVEKLLLSIDRSTLIGLRDYAIIHLMLATGLRCVEICRLDVADLHDEGRYLYLYLQRKGDTRKTQKFGITPEIVRPIRAYLEKRGVASEAEPLFVSHCSRGEHRLTANALSTICTNRMKAAGVHSPTKTTHSLRHTAAVRAIKAQIPIREVQVMLGHTKVETTEIYLRSLNDEMRLLNPAVKAMPLLPTDREDNKKERD